MSDAVSANSVYPCIVADPPWNQKAGSALFGVGEGWKRQASVGPTTDLPYGTMTVEEICALSVPSADNAALYLWTTNAYLPAAYEVAQAWGFKPSTMLVWAKNPMGGGLGGAFGITTEFCLYARKGSPVERKHTGTWFNWKRHYINGKPAHSAKPDGFYDLVQQVNDGPYLELFARRRRLGWDAWGNEVDSDLEIA